MSLISKAKEKIYSLLGKDYQYLIPAELKETDFKVVELAGKRIMTITRARNPAQTIIYPAVPEHDIWKTSSLTKLINDIDQMYEHGYIDICPIVDALNKFDLKATPSTLVAMEHLRSIHCIKFNNLHPEAFEAIPRYITHIFTEGRIPIDAEVYDGICSTATEP